MIDKQIITRLTATVLLAVITAGQILAQEMEPKLSNCQKAIIPIAAFAASGNQDRLSKALSEGLDAGLPINDIKEVLSGLYAYIGFPRSLNALQTFMSVLDTRRDNGVKDLYGNEPTQFPPKKSSLEIGTEIQTRLSGAPVKGGIMDFAPAVDYYLKAHLFGDIFMRDNIAESDREIATFSALSALEGTEGQMKAHIRYASNAGLTQAQIWKIADVLGEKVGQMEAYRANRVLSLSDERKYTMGKPIDDIFSRGKISTADYFTGTVWNQRLVSPDSVNRCQTSNVTFAAGARTRWHIHTGTQILLCTAGEGWYQEKGEPVKKLKQGDTVVIKPGVIHWHGAAADGEFSHISVIPNPQDNKDTWLEEVDETEYQSL